MSEYFSSFNIYAFVSNSIGCFFSLLGLSTFIYIYYNIPSLVNRTTLRLQAFLCLEDFLSHVRFYFIGKYSGSLCDFLAFIAIYLSSAYLCIVFSMTLCFHLNMLNASKFNYKNEKYFWYSIIILPILHVVPPYALGMLGPDENDICFINLKSGHYVFMLYYLFIIPSFIVYFYCVAIVLLVAFRIRGVNDVLDKILENPDIHKNNRNLLQRMLDSWMSKFIMYPLAFILIYTGTIIDFIIRTFNITSPIMFYLSTIGLYYSGLINYIALMWDPYFQDALLDIFTFSLDKLGQMKEKQMAEMLKMAEIEKMEGTTEMTSEEIRAMQELEDVMKDSDYSSESSFEGYREWNDEEARELLRVMTRGF